MINWTAAVCGSPVAGVEAAWHAYISQCANHTSSVQSRMVNSCLCTNPMACACFRATAMLKARVYACDSLSSCRFPVMLLLPRLVVAVVTRASPWNRAAVGNRSRQSCCNESSQGAVPHRHIWGVFLWGLLHGSFGGGTSQKTVGFEIPRWSVIVHGGISCFPTQLPNMHP